MHLRLGIQLVSTYAKYADESRSVKLIAAKTRVAPLTNQSITRLVLPNSSG